MTPTAKRRIKVEFGSTKPTLQIPKPIACNIDASRDQASRNARCYQHQPYLTGIDEPLEISGQPVGGSKQLP